MIKKTVFRKTLFFGIIMLFIGMGSIQNFTRNVGANNEEGLIACWHFDEGNKNIVYDSSDSDNSGFIYGATWTDGISGFAVELDGIDDYVSIPDSNSLDITGNITMEIWIYPYTMSWIAPLISKGTNSSNYGYHLAVGQYYSNGCVNFRLHSTGTETLWIDSNYPLTPGQWHYVAVVQAGNIARIYIDGMINNADSYFDSSIRTNNLPLELGTYNDHSEFFHGILDEVCIYNCALDANEIYNHYQETLNVSTWDEKPTPESPGKDIPGFEIIVVFISMAIVMVFSWKYYKRY